MLDGLIFVSMGAIISTSHEAQIKFYQKKIKTQRTKQWDIK
jgi:hypothetical protein